MIKLTNGVLIPKMGLGTFKMVDEEQTVEVLKEAIKVGYRHFDTAQMYHNEHIVGKVLKESGIPREEFFITSKLQDHHNSLKTEELILESLKKLETDYLDLLLIHWPNHDDSVNINTWKVFEKLYEEKKIRAIGVSNFSRYQLEQLLPHCKIKPMVNQVEIHPLLSQYPLIDYLEKHDMKPISYGPLMRGKLNDEPHKSIFEEIATKHNATIGQVVIAWGINRGLIMIPKTSTIKRLKENFDSKDIILSKEEIAKIDSINRGRRLYSDPSNNAYGLFIK